MQDYVRRSHKKGVETEGEGKGLTLYDHPHLEWRVVGSLMTITSATSPNLPKYSFKPSSVVCQERAPTNIFLGMENPRYLFRPAAPPCQSHSFGFHDAAAPNIVNNAGFLTLGHSSGHCQMRPLLLLLPLQVQACFSPFLR